MENNDFVQDVDFQEVNEGKEKVIRGKALYYSTKQVATILDEKDSKIRYYTKFFEDILNIETSNMQKQYTQEDIDKLKFIIDLKNDGMTLNQIKEYCQEVDFNDTSDITLKESNPLSIQVMAKALMEEQARQIESMKVDILRELKMFIEEQSKANDSSLEKLREEVCVAVDDLVSERLNDTIAEIQDTFKTSYVTRDEIEKFGKKESWISRLFK